MAERSKQKLKLIYLMQILMEKTDETHSITMAEMITALKAYGITAERKSLFKGRLRLLNTRQRLLLRPQKKLPL